MKKLFAFALIFTLMACASAPVQNEIVQEIVARRLAFALAKADPSIIEPGILACNLLLDAQDVDIAGAAAKVAADQLAKYVGNDPLLVADLESLIRLTGISGPKIDMPQLKSAAAAFRQGLELARPPTTI